MPADPYRILLVEDSEADVYLMRRALESAALNFELIVIEDGAEALAYAQDDFSEDSRPHAAVLDLNLPKSGGAEVLQALRENKGLAALPIVVLTSSAHPREKAAMQKLGVQRFITKPSDLDHFLNIGNVVGDLLKANAESGDTHEP